jgi:hypothetical protein
MLNILVICATADVIITFLIKLLLELDCRVVYVYGGYFLLTKLKTKNGIL